MCSGFQLAPKNRRNERIFSSQAKVKKFEILPEFMEKSKNIWLVRKNCIGKKINYLHGKCKIVISVHIFLKN